MKIKEGYVIRDLGEEIVVVPTGEEAARFNGVISLNATGRLLFETLQEGATKQELIALLQEHYDVSEEQLAQDVEAFLKTLRAHDILLET